jgi:hypothetical protein
MKAMPAEAQIKSFLAKYAPGIAAELRAARAALRALFPRGHELVYDNYNALVFAFSPTERSSEAFLSIAGYPRWITLFFLPGTGLHDPDGLLQGSGSQVRNVRLESARQLRTPAVRKLLAQAMAPHRDALKQAGPLATTIKGVSARQRPRRPAAAKNAKKARKG